MQENGLKKETRTTTRCRHRAAVRFSSLSPKHKVEKNFSSSYDDRMRLFIFNLFHLLVVLRKEYLFINFGLPGTFFSSFVVFAFVF